MLDFYMPKPETIVPPLLAYSLHSQLPFTWI